MIKVLRHCNGSVLKIKAGISLTFSAKGQLVFTGGQNILNWTSLRENLSSWWSNQVGKIILTAGQFAWFLALNETLWKVLYKIEKIIKNDRIYANFGIQIILTEHSKLAVSADKKPPLPSANTTANPPSKGLYSIARKLTPSVFKGIAVRNK